MKFRSQKKSGEALAVDHRADILDLLFSPTRGNESVHDGATCVVYISGPLEHRACPYGDSYEAIRHRFGEALGGDADTIVLRIDSPGGVVSGLNQAVLDMQRAAKNSGKRVLVYVDELACSAAYALSCVGEEIIVPPSGVVGSIGVRPEMCDQTAADEKAGIRWALITSGARKADGDPRIPISDEALAREQARVDDLARQFFAIVSDARGLSDDTIAGYQAGTFLGANAVEAGLADDVQGWEELLAEIDLARVAQPVSRSAVAQPGTSRKETPMSKLSSLITKAKAKLKAEKDPAKRKALKAAIAHHEALAAAELPPVALAAALGAMKKTKYKLEEEETVEEDDAEAEDADDMPCDEPDDDDKAEGDDKDKDAEDDGDDAEAESEESEEDAEDDEPKKDAKAGKRAALAAKAAEHDRLAAEVARLHALEVKREKASLIDAAVAGRRITRAHAKMLQGEKLSFVKGFLKMHTKALYQVDGEESLPDGSKLDAALPGGRITDQQMDMFRKAAAASGGTLTVDKLIENYRNNPNPANGIAGKAG